MDSYYTNFNPDVLALMPLDAARICEFGCGAGALAQAFRKLAHPCPVLQYIGVDINKDALSLSGPALSNAIQADLNEPGTMSRLMSSELPSATFDLLVCGDVLEHLVEPWTFLKQASQLLRPEGTAVLCIPNVQHWSTVATLVKGNWPRVASGLFDSTHLRWFTLDDMLSLVRDSSLQVTRVIPRIFDEDVGREIIDYMEPLCHFLGQSFDDYVNRSLPLQYVIEAKRL